MYHQLDQNYRPVGAPEEPPSWPAYPTRVKTFMYACGLFAEEEAIERTRVMAGGSAQRRAGVG